MDNQTITTIGKNQMIESVVTASGVSPLRGIRTFSLPGLRCTKFDN
jgi:hypothetical protein